MDRGDVARRLGVGEADILSMEHHNGHLVVTLAPRGERKVLTETGWEAYDEEKHTAKAEDVETGGENAQTGDPAADYEPNVSEPPTGDIDGDEVPDGNVKEVTDWVGDDRDRALRAYEAEQRRDNPRKSLLTDLERRLEVDEEG